MENLSDKVCLVFDYGNFLSFAKRLGQSDGFGTVYYYCPYVYNGYPDHKAIDFGRNVPGVIRVKEWATIIHEVDIVCFTDAHEPALQIYFQSIGKKIFGSKYASELEHDRAKTKEIMKALDLPINPYYVAHGMDELESLLISHDNVYVKSSLRGDMESWFHKNYRLSKGELLRMRNNLGAYANKETYIVEEPIESIAEVGIDTFSVSGRYPDENLCGIELKDTGYYGQIVPYKSLPKQLRTVTDRFAPIFRDLEYNGWHSNEVIISKDKKGYLIDLTQRNAQPPTDLALMMINNFPQVVWDVANGHVPVLQYEHKHGIQLIIKSELARSEPSPLIIPEEFQHHVQIKNLTIEEDGTWIFTPYGIEMVEIGSVCATGNSMNQALSKAKEIAESIEGLDIKINSDCIGKAKEQLENLNKNGITLF